MADYIKREDAIRICKMPNYNIHDILFALKVIPGKIIPAADGQRDRWINVEDALPKTDVRVIVYCDDPFDITPHFPHRKLLLIGYLDMENNWYDSDGPLENVTHWIPLPEPPEVKE